MKKHIIAAVVILFSFVVSAAGQSSASESVIIKAARLIDGRGGAALAPAMVRIEGNRYGMHWEDVLVKATPGHDALWGARNARMTLLAGFTTCREMEPTWPYVDVDLRKAIDDGAVPGPRLLVAGNYVSSTGGAGDAKQFSIYVDVPVVRNLADGPDEITKAIRTNFKHGADFIKILATGRAPVFVTWKLP